MHARLDACCVPLTPPLRSQQLTASALHQPPLPLSLPPTGGGRAGHDAAAADGPGGGQAAGGAGGAQHKDRRHLGPAAEARPHPAGKRALLLCARVLRACLLACCLPAPSSLAGRPHNTSTLPSSLCSPSSPVLMHCRWWSRRRTSWWRSTAHPAAPPSSPTVRPPLPVVHCFYCRCLLCRCCRRTPD